MLNVGFACTTITPPLGREIPGLFGKRFANAVEDELHARAVFVSNGHTRLALVQVDCIALPEAVVRAVRKEANRLCGIAGDSCLVAATHTHSGGPMVGCLLSDEDAEYQAYAASQIASAVAKACALQRPACIATEESTAPGVAFNRRFKLRDGSTATHPGKLHPDIVAPAGPEDPTVTVLGFRSPDETVPFGAIVHFACHATHMNGLGYSADYPRWIIDTLRAVYGPQFGVVFLNGASGDVTQVDNRSDRPYEFGPYWCRRTGEAVGAAAIQALAKADYFSDATLDVFGSRIRVPIRSVEPRERQEARKRLGKAVPAEDDIEAIYARELLLVDALRRRTPQWAIEIQAVRLADAALWTVPAELFQAFAERIRESSLFPHLLCVTLANGYAGYVCTPDAFAAGGYENRTARSSLLVPEAGDRIVQAVGRLLGRLYERGGEEVATLPLRVARIEGDDSALNGLRRATGRDSGRP